jgi:hypothetical protein
MVTAVPDPKFRHFDPPWHRVALKIKMAAKNFCIIFFDFSYAFG